jgi:adenylate cyclase
LEEANKEYGPNIVISESTWGYVEDRIASRELDIVRLKGKS